MRATRIIVTAALASAVFAGTSAPAFADPVTTVNCDPTDHGVTVEVLNTEIVEVCYS